jgi:transcriptional regulator with XRE-family HTH domain
MHDRPGRLYHTCGHFQGRPRTFPDISGHFRTFIICAPANKRLSREEKTTSNYRLRSAITKAGLLPDDLANAVGVDEKTVKRWLEEGRTPHARHRASVAKALHADELEIWADTKALTHASNPLREIQGAYPHASDPDWRELLDAASERIELLDITLSRILNEPGVIDQLAAKPAQGASVNILIADPHSAWAALSDQELSRNSAPDDPKQDSPIVDELDHTIEQLQPLLGKRGIRIRAFETQRFNTILRFDEQMLTTLHLYAEPTDQAPTLHLRREQDDGLFDRFAAHFEQVWQRASTPLQPHSEQHLITPPIQTATEPPPPKKPNKRSSASAVTVRDDQSPHRARRSEAQRHPH